MIFVFVFFFSSSLSTTTCSTPTTREQQQYWSVFWLSCVVRLRYVYGRVLDEHCGGRWWNTCAIQGQHSAKSEGSFFVLFRSFLCVHFVYRFVDVLTFVAQGVTHAFFDPKRFRSFTDKQALIKANVPCLDFNYLRQYLYTVGEVAMEQFDLVHGPSATQHRGGTQQQQRQH